MPRLLLAVLLGFSALARVFADDAALKSALTFHASFDQGLEADFAKGDPKLYTWIDRGKNLSKVGLHTDHKSDLSPDGKFVEIVELEDHPWYLACQFHPEFKSRPLAPHPLFKGFIAAAHRHCHATRKVQVS